MADKNGDNSNYKLVLDKLEEQSKTIEALKEQLNSVTEFNRELLSRKEISRATDEQVKAQQAFNDYINGK